MSTTRAPGGARAPLPASPGPAGAREAGKAGLVVLGAYFASVLLFSANYRVAVPMPFDLTADRLVLAVVALAWVLGVLHVRPGWPGAAARVNRPLALVLVVASVTLLTNAGAAAADGTLLTGAKRIVTLAGVMLGYSVVLALVRSRSEAARAVRLLVGLGVVGSAAAAAEWFLGSSPARAVLEALPFEKYQFTEVMTRADGLRAYGTAAHPVEFGAMMALLLPLGLYLFVNARNARAAVGWGAATAAIGAGMLFSVSRSSVLAATLALLVLLAFSKRRAAVLAVTLAGLAAAWYAFPHLLGTITAMLDPAWITRQEAAAVSGRMNDWGPAWEIIRTRPLFGLGYELFEARRYFFLDNQYLKTAIELGVVGLGAMLWLFGAVTLSLARGAWRAGGEERTPLEAALLASVAAYVLLSALFDTFGFFQVTNLFFVIVALAVVLASDAVGPCGADPSTEGVAPCGLT